MTWLPSSISVSSSKPSSSIATMSSNNFSSNMGLSSPMWMGLLMLSSSEVSTTQPKDDTDSYSLMNSTSP